MAVDYEFVEEAIKKVFSLYSEKVEGISNKEQEYQIDLLNCFKANSQLFDVISKQAREEIEDKIVFFQVGLVGELKDYTDEDFIELIDDCMSCIWYDFLLALTSAQLENKILATDDKDEQKDLICKLSLYLQKLKIEKRWKRSKTLSSLLASFQFLILSTHWCLTFLVISPLLENSKRQKKNSSNTRQSKGLQDP